MDKLLSFLLKLTGVVLQYALPYFLGKKDSELDHAKQSAKDVQKANHVRARVDLHNAAGTVDPRVRKFYSDGDVLPDSPANPKQHE